MEFNEQLKNRVKEINDIIHSFMPKCEGKQEKVIEAMNYSVDAGGKRIRPMIMLEVYRLLGGSDVTVAAPFMSALECIHTYSLVHDDLPAMDNDEYRRGQLTTHKKFGEDMGILAGDGLLNYAYEIMLKACVSVAPDMMTRCVKAAGVIAQKAGIYGMVGGQTLDVWLTGKTMTAEDLDFIFNLKTGALIEAAFMAGAILAGASDETVCNMEKAGRLVGVAFQIKDDILDVTGTQEVIGKPVLSDEKNNKTTYVTLYGIDKAQADVDTMSRQAVQYVRAEGENEFLVELIYQLINREK